MAVVASISCELHKLFASGQQLFLHYIVKESYLSTLFIAHVDECIVY